MPAFLLPLLLNLAPTVAGWVLGDKTGNAVNTVSQIIKQTTGLDGDPTDALNQRPELVFELKKALIEAETAERERQHQEVLAQLADLASARNQTVELAKTGSTIAWGAPVVSVLAVCVFAGFVVLLFTKNLPDGMKDALMLLAGSAAAGFGSVLNYWLGSSAGSAHKDSILSSIARK
jgi:hypothetical protein